MALLNKYEKFTYKFSGKWVEKYLIKHFTEMQFDLRKAGIRITLVEYLSKALTTSMIVFVIMVPLISVIFTILLLSIGFVVFKSSILGITFGLLGGIISSVIIFMLFYINPSIHLKERRKRIDDSLPFATLYLATIAGSGTPVVTMFKTLANFKEYGEVSKEAKRIVDETEVMGMDITNALENAAARTPSESFKEMLWGIKTTISVGGDLKAFLHEKSESAMQEHKRRLSQFTKQLSLLIEVYITLVFVGSIFFMILSTIMGTLTTGSQGMMIMIQLMVTFIFLPLASIGLIVLIKGISPTTVE